MQAYLDVAVLRTLTTRTLKSLVESPIAYVVAIFFYGFVGGVFGVNFFLSNQAAIDGIGGLAPWVLWFVVPALTMGLISEELRSGTFEQLATLPLRDWEIVLGKFFGFGLFSFFLIFGLVFFPLIISSVAQPPHGLDWGASIGVLFSLYFMMLCYGAMGLFASSLARNQVVALILGMIFCTFFFFVGQFTVFFSNFIGGIFDFVGISSHVSSMGRGVWDLRDLVYFGSLIIIFLYLCVQRLTTRRF